MLPHRFRGSLLPYCLQLVIATVVEGIGRDPHMHGLLGQAVDWKGVDGAWYAILSDSADMQLSVRLTAPLPQEFPDRQLMTAVAIKYNGGHSIVIENRHPYTTETEGCNDLISPCLSDNSLRFIVDGKEQPAVPMENFALPGQATITAVNLPPECQPYGGDMIWAETYANMVSRRRLAAGAPTFREWAHTWTRVTAAPTWCEKYLEEAGDDGAMTHRGKHTAFRIETPAFTIRMHHGTNHQGGEVLTDGRVLPELEFWQIDLHLERYDFDAKRVTGMLGETMRPVLDSQGVPIISGVEAIRGQVEDYRISGPLATDFAFYHD